MVLRDLVNFGFLPEDPQQLIEMHNWYVYTIVHRWRSYTISRNQKRRGHHHGEGDVAAFENDESGSGPIAPHSPDWSNIKGPWNHALLVLFMAEYVKEYTVEEDDQDDICKMFMDRLARLRKKVKQLRMRPDETQVQMTARHLVNHRRLLLMQRRNTRRNEVNRFFHQKME